MLGLLQMKIQRGVGSGNITIDEIDTAKSIILASTVNIAYGDGTVVNTNNHATIVNSTTINCGTTMAWTVIEFGGAVSD